MANKLTVGQLKKALVDVPDWVPVKLISDSGVDQSYEEIVIKDAYYQAPYYNNYRCFCIVAEEYNDWSFVIRAEK